MVYILLADGFEEIEALTQVDYLRRAGINIYTVGLDDECILGGHDIPVICDITFDDVVIDAEEKLEMVILPGGMGGVNNLASHPGVRALLEYCVKQGVYIAAICAAPTILSGLGMLKEKKATCYPSMQKELNCRLASGRVVTDGNIITSVAAGSSEEFALELIRVLRSEKEAEKVKNAIYAR